MRLVRRAGVVVALVALAAVTALGGPASAARGGPAPSTGGGLQVVASGLDNPRGIAIGPGGALFVAESGAGGSGPCTVGPEGNEVCFGPSGAITRVAHGTHRRVVTGLPSVADKADGSAAIGPVDVSFAIRVLAVFPPRLVPAPPGIPGLPPEVPMQAVPTSVTVGPDGAYYVGQLTGFPFPVGGARVFRVVPGQQPQVFARGFTNIIDVAFDGRGRLHVLEIAKNGILSEDFTGRLVRVNRDGSRTVLASEGLFAPGGFVIAKDGSIYVTNNGILAGAGQVVRIPPR